MVEALVQRRVAAHPARGGPRQIAGAVVAWVAPTDGGQGVVTVTAGDIATWITPP